MRAPSVGSVAHLVFLALCVLLHTDPIVCRGGSDLRLRSRSALIHPGTPGDRLQKRVFLKKAGRIGDKQPSPAVEAKKRYEEVKAKTEMQTKGMHDYKMPQPISDSSYQWLDMVHKYEYKEVKFGANQALALVPTRLHLGDRKLTVLVGLMQQHEQPAKKPGEPPTKVRSFAAHAFSWPLTTQVEYPHGDSVDDHWDGKPAHHEPHAALSMHTQQDWKTLGPHPKGPLWVACMVREIPLKVRGEGKRQPWEVITHMVETIAKSCAA